jgi:hypothetical protein
LIASKLASRIAGWFVEGNARRKGQTERNREDAGFVPLYCRVVGESGDAFSRSLRVNGGSKWAESTVHGSLKLSKQSSAMMRVAFLRILGLRLSCHWVDFRGHSESEAEAEDQELVCTDRGKSME